MNTNDLTDIASQLLDRAKAHGAEAADAVIAQSSSEDISVRMGALEDIERSESTDLGLRVFIGKSQANISTTDFSSASLDQLAERCVQMAKAAPDDPYCGLADADLLARDWADYDLYDPTTPEAEKLKEMALEMETTALEVKGIANSLGSSASYGSSGMVLATSAGFLGAYQGSSFSLSCSVLAGEGRSMERDYDYSHCVHFEDLADPSQVGRNAAERTLKKLNPQKISSQAVPVIYDPRVSGGLVRHFAGAISGAAIARKTSFLKDEMGTQVFSSAVNIIDDPHRRRGLRTRPFDGEGVETRKMHLVEDGVLKTWLLDISTAKQLNLKTMGHASRGIGGPPSPGPSNLYFEAGTKTPQELISDISQGLYITDLIGMGVNGVTGDYSRGASGFWIENGELAYPVSEITIAGNLKDMFRTIEAADDLEFRYGTDAPSLRVEGLMVAGT